MRPKAVFVRRVLSAQILLRGLEKVRAEMNLQMLSYNFKRVFNIIGIAAFKNHLNERNMA
jgi:hypothetical protein